MSNPQKRFNRDAYDHNIIVVDGVPLPGKGTITGASIPTKWNERDGHGLTGASISYTGRKLATFTITLEMWTQPQLDQWAFTKKLFDPPKINGPKLGHSIQHPQLADVDIDSFVVTDRSPPVKDKSGRWIVTIQCKEYRAPLPSLVKIRGAIPPAGGTPSAAQTEADKALVAAKAEAQKAMAAAQ